MANEEPISTTILTIKITSEAPYARNITIDAARELAETLDFTGMYSGSLILEEGNGEVLASYDLGVEHD